MTIGVTRFILALGPLIGWIIQLTLKDIRIMKFGNIHYWRAWQIFWIGYLVIFLIPASLFIPALVTDSLGVKFAFWFFVRGEWFFSYAIQFAAWIYFLLAPIAGSGSSATGIIEMWLVWVVQTFFFFWYSYTHYVYGDALKDWYFNQVGEQRFEEQPPEVDEDEVLADITGSF